MDTTEKSNDPFHGGGVPVQRRDKSGGMTSEERNLLITLAEVLRSRIAEGQINRILMPAEKIMEQDKEDFKRITEALEALAH
jgi:hypothetical protein